MAEHLITLPCDRLETGMYVAELDRSWLHTPFAGPGLFVSFPEQIESLRSCCNYVYVDPSRSEPGLFDHLRPATHAAVEAANDGRNDPEAVLNRITDLLAGTVLAARSFGRIEVAPVIRAADLLVEAALGQGNACLWLLRTGRIAGLMYRRAIGTALHAVILGRQLDMSRSGLRQLAIGGLLLDIGKTSVPMPILVKPRRLTTVEWHFVERHVWQGFTLARFNEDIDERALDMVLGHHERLDGRGYPRALRGTDIPLFGRIAAIVDSYDALTVNRHYATGISPHDALRTLNKQRGQRFDADLVREFIHAVGVYPTGTRVKMTDGKTGIVCAQNPDWPLRPQILQTENALGDALTAPRLLNAAPDNHIGCALPPSHTELSWHDIEGLITAESS